MPRMPTISSCACRAWLPPATSRETPCNRQASADANLPLSTLWARLSVPIFLLASWHGVINMRVRDADHRLVGYAGPPALDENYLSRKCGRVRCALAVRA